MDEGWVFGCFYRGDGAFKWNTSCSKQSFPCAVYQGAQRSTILPTYPIVKLKSHLYGE